MTEKEIELRQILETMHIPNFRMHQMNETNLNWLKRNLLFDNGAHPDIDKAFSLIADLLANRTQ